jgi:hypothetical protein
MTKIVIGNPCQSSDWVMNTLIVTRLMVSMRLRGRLRELGGGGVTSVAAAIDHRGSQPQEVTCAALVPSIEVLLAGCGSTYGKTPVTDPQIQSFVQDYQAPLAGIRSSQGC